MTCQKKAGGTAGQGLGPLIVCVIHNGMMSCLMICGGKVNELKRLNQRLAQYSSQHLWLFTIGSVYVFMCQAFLFMFISIISLQMLLSKVTYSDLNKPVIDVMNCQFKIIILPQKNINNGHRLK